MSGVTEAARGIAEIGRGLQERSPFGAIRVIGFAGELTTDHDGDAVVRLRLTLSDPPAGRTTWALDDVDTLQQEAARLANEADLDLPYLVTELYPETPDADEDAEDGLDDDLSNALDSDSSK